MRFARGFVHLPTFAIVGFQEADESHECDLFVAVDVVGVCLGLIDSAIGENAHSSWLINNIKIATINPLTLRFKNPAHEKFLHRCPTMADQLQSGDHDLPEPVKTHLRQQWAHREDLSIKTFKSIGFTTAEIAELPKFQLLRHKQRLANQEKAEADLANKKATIAAARLAKNIQSKGAK